MFVVILWKVFSRALWGPLVIISGRMRICGWVIIWDPWVSYSLARREVMLFFSCMKFCCIKWSCTLKYAFINNHRILWFFWASNTYMVWLVQGGMMQAAGIEIITRIPSSWKELCGKTAQWQPKWRVQKDEPENAWKWCSKFTALGKLNTGTHAHHPGPVLSTLQ